MVRAMLALPTAPRPSRFQSLFGGQSRVLPAVRSLHPRDCPEGISEQAELIVGRGMAGAAVTARGVLRLRTTRAALAMFFGGLAVLVVHTPQDANGDMAPDLLRGIAATAFVVGLFCSFYWLTQMLSLLFQSRAVIDGSLLFVRRGTGWERIDLRSIDKILLAPVRQASVQALAGKSFTHVYGVRVATFPDPARDDLVNSFLLSFEALRRVAGMLPPTIELRMGSFLTDEKLIVAHIFATARANPDHTSWSLLGTKQLKKFAELCASKPAPRDVIMVRYEYGAVQQDDDALKAAILADGRVPESDLTKMTVSRTSEGAVIVEYGTPDEKVKKSQRTAVLLAIVSALILLYGQWRW